MRVISIYQLEKTAAFRVPTSLVGIAFIHWNAAFSLRGRFMGGRRKDFDGAFAMLDTNFILDDPRIISLPVSARWVYLCLWCLAVRTRHSTIPAYEVDAVSVARRTGFRPYLVSTSYLLLEKVPTRYRVDPEQTASRQRVETKAGLIKCNIDGTITVFGVQEKHPNLKWKKPYKLIYAPLLEKEKEKEKNARAREIVVLDQSGNTISDEEFPDTASFLHALPYSHPKVMRDSDYKEATNFCKKTQLSKEEKYTIDAVVIWPYYYIEKTGTSNFRPFEQHIRGLRENGLKQKDILQYVKDSNMKHGVPVWEFFKKLKI